MIPIQNNGRSMGPTITRCLTGEKDILLTLSATVCTFLEDKLLVLAATETFFIMICIDLVYQNRARMVDCSNWNGPRL